MAYCVTLLHPNAKGYRNASTENGTTKENEIIAKQRAVTFLKRGNHKFANSKHFPHGI